MTTDDGMAVDPAEHDAAAGVLASLLTAHTPPSGKDTR